MLPRTPRKKENKKKTVYQLAHLLSNCLRCYKTALKTHLLITYTATAIQQTIIVMQISAIADGDGPVPGEKEHLVSLFQKQND